MQDNYTLRDLLNARLHLGHKTNKWNPKMAPFIYGSENNVHIIDLRKTFDLLQNALDFVKKIAQEVPDEILEDACSRQDYSGKKLITDFLKKK